MLALIPARGGSKGLPRKNILSFCGKPLIAYTIEAAKNAKGIDRVVVTTDDQEIAEISREFGAEVPFLRPEELSNDTAQARDVYIHAVEFMKLNGYEDIGKFMVLLPTAPLREARHIEEALDMFYSEKADTLVSMTKAETPISWYFTQNESGRVRNADLSEDDVMSNRQKNREFLIPNGAIYILDYNLLINKKTYYSDNTIPYIMSREESVDIDTRLDFDFATFMYTYNK